METTNQIFCVDRQEINYLRVIIESYDGMAIVRTIDPYDALIEIQISPGCEDILFMLLKSLERTENIKLKPASKVSQVNNKNE
ncbi:DUF4911 domain-containing protein [Thermodesulfobacteriota bacterium]